jgi:2'-hydroxyisoflavone reductase
VKVLVLGGTVFLGRHIVDALLASRHDVTLFNRGQSNPGLFPDLETIHGDRTRDLALLDARHWDAVIDIAGYVPRVVRASATRIDAAHYTFISSISVYADFSVAGIDETHPVATVIDPENEDPTGERYGPLKALCERVVLELHSAALIIRPGLIVGPHDPTDRFTYWPQRVAQGGEVLAPESPGVPVQVIDARDLAAWTVRMVERRTAGTFNATGPAAPLHLGDVLTASQQASGVSSNSTYVSEAFLFDEGVAPWMEMPLWVGSSPAIAGFASVAIGKAVSAGLAFRPIAETVRDTLQWHAARAPAPLRAGITGEREAQLLAKWHARR